MNRFFIHLIFISGLILLALNDHYFKWEYSNGLTGKLSDFVGLFILPIFLNYLLPSREKLVCVFSGAFFIFWKLPLSSPFIKLYNEVALIPITRTVDYSDLLALVVLPFSYLLLKNKNIGTLLPLSKRFLLLLPASFVFMGTSPPLSYYHTKGGDIYIGKIYKLKMTKEEILQSLNSQGFKVVKDSLSPNQQRFDHYIIQDIVLLNRTDTIKAIQFSLTKSSQPHLLLNYVSLSPEWKTSSWRELKRESKKFRKLVEKAIIEEL